MRWVWIQGCPRSILDHIIIRIEPGFTLAFYSLIIIIKLYAALLLYTWETQAHWSRYPIPGHNPIKSQSRAVA
jgi:prolipoprotein diacylglyceryltransferase